MLKHKERLVFQKQNPKPLFQASQLQATKFYEIGDLVKIKGGFQIIRDEGFPGGTVVENLPANAGDAGSCPGLGGSHMPRSN